MDNVELFQISFPRLTRKQAIQLVLDKVKSGAGQAVCFPDASMVNLLEKEPKLKDLVKEKFQVLNDGAGLSLASYLKGKPFPENLNGTDFTPLLLESLPQGTTLYLVGASKSIVAKTLDQFQSCFSHLNFLGSHSGYFTASEEVSLISTLKELQPEVILVGMGNPKQLLWINKLMMAIPSSKTSYFAVGGLFDFYGGKRKRAPFWMIKMKLEWLHILLTESHKLKRYLLGVPLFLLYLGIRCATNSHSSLSAK